MPFVFPKHYPNVYPSYENSCRERALVNCWVILSEWSGLPQLYGDKKQCCYHVWLYTQERCYNRYTIKPLWPSGAIWRQGSRSTSAQVMAICRTAPSLCLKQFDISSVRPSSIHLRVISQEMPQPSITKICLKITCLKFNSNLPGANELTSAHIN